MTVFYHVDRLNVLEPGMHLELEHLRFTAPPEIPKLTQFAKDLFPKGVSRHGAVHIYHENESVNKEDTQIIELFFEYYRRCFFPNRPSRFQSWFGVESYDCAKEFRREFGHQESSIWKVEVNGDCFKADMNLLSNRKHLVSAYFADLYWSGKQSPIKAKPFWEYLLTPPIKVLEKIDE